jgi:acetylornithine deacetylase/succinyl-diaminopimelate desuccinylase-like protein
MPNTQQTNNIKEALEKDRSQWLKEYYQFLSFPSVSSEPEYKKSLLECADWLMKYLKDIHFNVELWPTSGHPVIFASNLEAGPDKPTLLIYNHYDVQPVDPLELWNSDPFKPTEKEGQIYARGAQDNKGQCFYVIQALKYLIQQDGKLPINIKLCIEGEEEIGSHGLSGILKDKSKQLKADYLAIVDLGIEDPKIPALTLGIRGIVTMDVEVIGSKTDLHSGTHGGIAKNPIHALVELLASLRDESGGVTVPGFYNQIIEMTDDEKESITFDFDANEYYKTIGGKPVGGEIHLNPNERAWLRPTLEVNGINGGYWGQGFKTVIPAKATAKISCRLVPDQDPKQVAKLVANYLEKNAPEGVQVKASIRPGHGKAVRIKPSSKVVKAFAQAFEEVFNHPCEYILAGGSIPIVTELAEASGGEVLMMGLGLDSDLIHAPNEHFGIDRIEKGIQIMAKGIKNLK